METLNIKYHGNITLLTLNKINASENSFIPPNKYVSLSLISIWQHDNLFKNYSTAENVYLRIDLERSFSLKKSIAKSFQGYSRPEEIPQLQPEIATIVANSGADTEKMVQNFITLCFIDSER